jgi:O-antigen/teichoic acid export membrane protein
VPAPPGASSRANRQFFAGRRLDLHHRHLVTEAAIARPAVAAPRPLTADHEQPRRALAGAGALFVAMGGSGALTYAFHVLAARSLGPEGYGQIAVLWAAMFVAAVVLYRPIEQTASRAIAARLARGEDATAVLRTVSVMCGAVVVAALAAIVLARDVITTRLFLGDGELTAMFAVGVAVYAVAYLTRGVLAGVSWFRGYGIALVADTAARFALALPLVLIASQRLAAAAVVTAGVFGVIVPAAVGRRQLARRLRGREGGHFRVGSALAFAAPVSVIAAADQLLVNGGPLIVVLLGGAGAGTAAGVVFAATMLVRVPVYLFQGLATSLLPNLTRMSALDDPAHVRRAVIRLAGLLVVASAAVAAPAAAIGPEAMRLLYGPGFDAARLDLAVLGSGVGCYLAAGTCSQALLALGRPGRAAAAWALSCAVFVVLAASVPGGELQRISVAFAAAAVTAAALLAGLLVGRRRP